MADLWVSERLYYREIEPDDEKFISTIYEDASTTINASPYTPTPRSSADCQTYIKHMEACLLGVAVCLKDCTSAWDLERRAFEKRIYIFLWEVLGYDRIRGFTKRVGARFAKTERRRSEPGEMTKCVLIGKQWYGRHAATPRASRRLRRVAHRPDSCHECHRWSNQITSWCRLFLYFLTAQNALLGISFEAGD